MVQSAGRNTTDEECGFTTVIVLLLLGTVGCGKAESMVGNTVRENHWASPQTRTQWEKSREMRKKRGISCKPQTFSRTLVSANNFYSYRDGKVFLDLNGTTGEFRRLTVAEGKGGETVYTRLLGCYYERNDSVFGDQLLLDTDSAASSQYFDPIEIFTFTTTVTTMEAVRFDDSSDWTAYFCPILDTLDSFCALLRNGNDLFFPALTVAQKGNLLVEAILIRRQFNFVNYAPSAFDPLWTEPPGIELVREDYKYAVQAIVDTPRYIEGSWIKFVKRQSNRMPDITSNRVPPVCYSGRRTVTLSDGSTSLIYGQICYSDGEYIFQ